jgi:Uma2 family endonuclease
MTITVAIPQIKLTPGSKVSIDNISWADFQTILEDLGENRNTRITYYQGLLEIMSPLALHERSNRIMADIVKVILQEQGRQWEDFGSTTLKKPEKVGIEPDSCFYIQNVHQVIGCTHLDLGKYPPPDLAIESDVTSKTAINAYEALQVPEVWIYDNGELKIYLFSAGSYQQTNQSLTFPDLPIVEMIPKLIQKAIEKGTSLMLNELKFDLRKSN